MRTPLSLAFRVPATLSLATLLIGGCVPTDTDSRFGGGGTYDPDDYAYAGDDDDDDDDGGGYSGGGSSGGGSNGGGSSGGGSNGGGSNGGGNPPAPGTCGALTHDWPSAWGGMEEDVLEAINAARAAGANCGSQGTFAPAPPLQYNDCLTDAARLHAEDMGVANYFSHVSLDGRMFSDRLQETSYGAFRFAGENIAAGYATAYEVVAGWLNSDGHCRNLMDPNFTEVGTGYYYGPSSDYYHVWVQNFATPL